MVGTERARTPTPAIGTPCETIVSLPFGDGQSTSGSCSDSSPLHFMDKERDPESNLDDFGARFYSSTYGRWMSPDWSATPEPVPYANLSNPQSLNLYALVQDNPETFADLDGHDPDAQGPGNLTGTNGLGPCQKNEPCSSTIPGPSMTQDEQAAAEAKAQIPLQAAQNGGEGTPANNLSFLTDLEGASQSPAYKVGVPEATGDLLALVNCTNTCSNVSITVTSTSEPEKQHPAGDPHTKGEAADLRVPKGAEERVLHCAAVCGAGFGLNERDHPSSRSTAPHVHVQTVPGSNGSRGDLPPVDDTNNPN